MAVEDLVKVKEAVSDKLESMKHLVVTEMREQMHKQMQLFGLTPADLGFSSPAKGPKKAVGERKRELDPTKPCKICGFATAPENHDARWHRGGKPAMDDEMLRELGLTKV